MNITIEALRGAVQRSARLHQIGGHTLTILDADALDCELAVLDVPAPEALPEPEAPADDAQMDLLAPPTPPREQALADLECPPAPEAPPEPEAEGS